MSLINCPECKKAVSDKVDDCIHCGFPLSKNEKFDTGSKQAKTYRNSENQINKSIDAIFALMYIYLLYRVFFTDTLSDMDSSGAGWFGIFIGFVLMYFVQKMVKAILGTIARSFDDAFNKKNT